MSLRQDVERTNGLNGHYRRGIQALKPIDRNRITIAEPIGSVDVDAALQGTYPHDARWDYLIGRRCGTATQLHWVEIHPANGDHTIGEVASKLNWLKKWVSGTPLNSYERRFHWVASGKCPFNARYPRIRSLVQKGVEFAGQHLTIGERR